jgi:hypothetical protein
MALKQQDVHDLGTTQTEQQSVSMRPIAAPHMPSESKVVHVKSTTANESSIKNHGTRDTGAE